MGRNETCKYTGPVHYFIKL